MKRNAHWLLAVLLVCAARQAGAQSSPADAKPAAEGAPLNLTAQTMGGLFFWTDELVHHDWRIQRHALTGHCRLLDDTDRRLAWGRFEQCRAKLETWKQKKPLPALGEHVVIVLHGLGRSRVTMQSMCDRLRQSDEFTVLNVSYASTRAPLGEHAAALARVIDNLEGVQRVSFVAHSLGNLVIRRYLFDQASLAPRERSRVHVERIVMLGPPNNGAQLAERLGGNRLYRLLAGASGNQLASEWDEVQARLANPHCQFGIIAGGHSTDSGVNPLIEGDDDLVVRVEETRLAGARDFAVLPVYHTTMMNDARVQEYSLRFLRYGYFQSERDRRPIGPSGGASDAP